MNVLVLHAQLGLLRGGGENFSRNLFAAFAERGHHVKVAFATNRLGRFPALLPDNVQPLPVRGWWSVTPGQGALTAVGNCLARLGVDKSHWDRVQNALDWRGFNWHNRRFGRRVARELSDHIENSDVVYVHHDPVLAFEMAKRRPTVLRLPGPVGPALAPLLRQVHAVCANGDALSQLRAFMGTQVIDLPVGLDDRLFSPGATDVRARLGWSDDCLVLGYAGRLSKLKGIDLLTEAFKTILKGRRDARLLILGTGPEESNARAALKHELAAGLVQMVPDVRHDQLPHWYRAMSLLIMPSRYENYSNAVLEAMGCGIPFAASDVGGNRVLAESGGAWLFTPNSAESLASVVESALKQPETLRARGRAARAFVHGRYSWSITAKRLEDIFCNLPLTVSRLSA